MSAGEDERARAGQMVFALLAIAMTGIPAGQAYLLDFRALLLETAMGSVDGALDARSREENTMRFDDILPDPGSPAMPDPVNLVCSACGATFTCDRASEAARADPLLCPDCAFPELRGL